jgi:hypothetical protein
LWPAIPKPPWPAIPKPRTGLLGTSLTAPGQLEACPNGRSKLRRKTRAGAVRSWRVVIYESSAFQTTAS